MLWTLVAILAAAHGGAPDTIVVCPPEFRAALEPWLAYRAGQGHRIAILNNGFSPAHIRQQIRHIAQPGGARFVVLVGDAEPDMAFDPQIRRRSVPVDWAPARVNVLWGSEPHIATDNAYADLDDDGVPELAVGRLTADTPEELAVIVRKIIRYERSQDFGPWRRRINVVAGTGGFGLLADMVLESAARYLLTGGIPPEYDVSMTYANWRSPYCPDPRSFRETTLARLNEGCRFWVYIGHGHHVALDMVRVPGKEYPIFSAADSDRLHCRRGLPIALFLACYAGALDARQDCLAEHMLRSPGGPVAVIAGSRVTMPYGMAVLGMELMAACFDRRCQTLGEALLHAKRRLVRPPSPAGFDRAAVEAVAQWFSPAGLRLAEERQEHVLLFNLIGDPLLRLMHPQPVRLRLEGAAEPGGRLRVEGWSAVDGSALVELAVRRDRLTFSAPLRAQYPRTPEQLAAFQQVYAQANNHRLALSVVQTHEGHFVAWLPVPGQARGPCYVRVFVQGRDGCAAGAKSVQWPESRSGESGPAMGPAAKDNRQPKDRQASSARASAAAEVAETSTTNERR